MPTTKRVSVRAAPRLAALGALLVAACAANPTPVLVVGTPSETSRLAGAWEGQCASVETERSGSISVSLREGADTAFGDVVMVPRAVAPSPSDPRGAIPIAPQVPQVLKISFVRAAINVVNGTLDPYKSPDCGCMLHTLFQGTIEGDRISGTFTTRHSDRTAPQQKGTWWAKRSGAVAAEQ
jgi:hypothetical protein